MLTTWEFEAKLSQLTMHDLYEIHTQLYHEYPTAPLWTTGVTKSQQIRNFTRWVKGDHERVVRVLDLVDQKIQERKMIPKGLAAGTRYITKEELESLSSFPELVEAIEFPFKAGKCDPFTRDSKYVSVAAIYNMSAWASWKSSSLSGYERSKAEAVHKLHLGDLMTLNRGRRIDQPALFPETGLLR